MATMRRRELLGAGLAGAGALTFGSGFWRTALAARARVAESAYGPLEPADANGLMLPPGFTAREVARANRLVPGTTYSWHIYCDGQSTFATEDGGWVLVSNSEAAAAAGGGASALRFDPGGTVADAYRILGATNANCAGGATPWGTWLSCEEHDGGHVWECAPGAPGQGAIRPAMGTFNHEAVAVDPVARTLYMTEDRPDGGLYRFTPKEYPILAAGVLEVGAPSASGNLTWVEVPDPAGLDTPVRRQVPDMRRFNGGEGIWFDSGRVYFSTKGDNRVWAYDTQSTKLGWIYDATAAGPDAPLRGVDNLTVSRAGEIFVCEDGGNMEICVIAPDRSVAPFLRLTGEAAAGPPDRGNELCGVVFDPSGRRLYFAAQRAYGFGAVYEVTGPFLGLEAPPAPVVAPAPAAEVVPPPVARSHQDADAPGLHLRVRRRTTVARLRRRGLTVRVHVDAPAMVTGALRTDDLASVPGARGSSARPDTVTLARSRGWARRGIVELRFHVDRREAARLRAHRSVLARVTVVAKAPDGAVSVASHRVRIVAGGRRAHR
jgi:secreted PhoX family phosphatase